MKRYEKYKDSGVKWIGEIPEHWKAFRNKDIFQESKELVGDNSSEYILLSLTKQGVIKRDLSENKGKFPKDFYSYKKVVPGDIIFCLFDVDETPRTVGLSNNYGMITGAYNIFKIKRVLPEYVLYYYLSIDDKKALKPLYKGLRKVVPLPAFMSSKIYLPSLNEQKVICDFLYKKIIKIDDYIAAREKEITLVDSLKQSIIAKAVTKGLNPNAPMKNSGIPWIGMIPEHWEIKKIRSCFKERKEKVSDKNFAALSVTKNGITPQLETAVKTDNGDNRKKVSNGDFVVNSRSDRKGSCGLSRYEGSVSLINIVIIPQKVNGWYYHFLFRSNNYIEEFYRQGRGIVADLWTTRYSEMRNIYIPVPPLIEQQAIVAYLDSKIKQIDTYKESLLSEIDYIQQFQSQLQK